MKNNRLLLVGIGAASCLLSACQWKHVVDYSAASSKTMEDSSVATGYTAYSARFKQSFPGAPEIAGKDIQIEMTKLQGTYDAYFKALGALAAGDPVNYKKQFDAFDKSLTASKLVDASKSKAISSVGNAIVSLASEGLRERAFVQILGATNVTVQNHMKVLIKDANRYKENLDKEQKLIHLIDIGRKPQDPASDLMWHNTVGTMGGQIQADKAKADAFIKAVGAVAAGHQKLKDEAGHLTADQVKAAVNAYKDMISDAYKALNP